VYFQNAASTLALALGGTGVRLVVGSGSLGGTLALAGFATGTGGGAGGPDFVAGGAFKSAGATTYDASLGLAWHTGGTAAHGTFTLGSGEAFELDIPRADTAANAAQGWNGAMLTKAGAGALTISASLAHTGATIVTGGTLALTGAGAVSGPVVNHAALVHSAAAGPARVVIGGALDNRAGASDELDVLVAGDVTNAGRLAIASGTFLARLANSGTVAGSPADPENFALPIVTVAVGDATFTTPDRIVDGLSVYSLARGNGGALLADPHAWYLAYAGQNRTAGVILGTAAILGADWHYSLDSLHQRMGDLRAASHAASHAGSSGGSSGTGDSPVSGNVWLRTNAYRLNAVASLAGAPFRQTAFPVTAGLDRVLSRPGADATLYAGGFIQMGRAVRDYERLGNSDTGGASLGLYATAIHAAGWHAGATLKLDRYKHTLDVLDPADPAPVTARYASRAAGLSVELGRRITLTPTASRGTGSASGGFGIKNLWLEPGVQTAVAFLGSAGCATGAAGYATGSAIAVRLDRATAWQTRAQLRAGATFARWTPCIKFAEVRGDTRGGALHADGRSCTPDFDGWRFETGFGASCLIDALSQFYFDYEYNKSPVCGRPWSLTLGYRRLW
jgi:outer membrane autotransporter protein